MSANKILVVEDDRLVRNYILEGLQDLPYELIFAENGLEGVQKFTHEKPDLVLVDVLLPKMSGFEVCQNIRSKEEGKNLPVIFMSAVYKSLAVQNEAKTKYGANDFLNKPLNLNLLRDRLATFLHTEHAAQIKDETGDSETEVTGPGAGAKIEKSVQGDFSRETFAAVFFKIYRHRETGALHLTRDKVKKTIFFEEGIPVAVQSNLLNETLARTLQALGKLTSEQIEDTRIIARERKKLHGQVLMDLKLLTKEELDETLAFQLREKLLNVFTWMSGNYAFVRGSKSPDHATTGVIDVPPVFIQGTVERMPFDIVRDRLSPMADHFPAWDGNPAEPLAGFRLEPEERIMLKEIDGLKTLKQTLQSVKQPDYLLRLIYALAVAGTLRLPEETSQDDLAQTQKIQKEIGGAKDVEEAPRIDEEFSLVERIAHKYTTLESDNYFQLLEVPEGASPDEVRQAYLRLSKMYHPEKVAGAVDESSRDKVEAIYVKLTTAYEILCDDEDREEYLEQLKSAQG